MLKGIFSSSTAKDKKAAPGAAADEDEDDKDDDMVIEVEENERFSDKSGWSKINLKIGVDPKTFVYSGGTQASDTFPTKLAVADGWEFKGKWEIELIKGSTDGWFYGADFQSLSESNLRAKPSLPVRSRRWIRIVTKTIEPPARPPKAQSSNSLPTTATSAQRLPSIRRDVSHGSDEGTKSVSRESSVVDPAEAQSQSSWFGFGGSSEIAQKYIIKDPALQAIGKQLKIMEDQADKEEAERVKHFKSDRRPVLQGQIKNLESLCTDLRQKIEVDVKKGLEHIAQLEASLAMNTERLEDLKKQYFFYKSALVYGENGIYMGLDDVWLEIGAGCFLVDLVPVNRKMPELIILMSGVQQYSEYTMAPQGEVAATGEDTGVTLKIRLEGVKLSGENLSIPKMNFELVDIVLSVRASMSLRFDLAQSKWEASAKDFSLEVLSFKGPYGLSKTLMSPLLSMLSPTLRRFMVNRMPPELGTLIRTFPSPFSMRGEFEAKGIDLQHLKAPLAQSSIITSISGYSSSQLDMFFGLQKSMDRSKPLRSISDVLSYRRKFIKNERYIRDEKIWESLQSLWEQASSVYSELYHTNNPSECEDVGSGRSTGRSGSMDNGDVPLRGYPDIKFSRIVYTGLQLLRKSITADFQLMQMDGQFNLNHLLRHMHQWMHRVASKKGDRITALQNAKAKQQIDKAHVNYELGLDILKLICRNLDFANMAFNLGMKTGLKGTVHMSIKDILAQAPMKIQSVLNEDKNLGRTPLVPMLVHTTPKSNGDVIIQVYHVIKEAHIDSIAIGMNSSNSNIDVAVGMGSSSVGRNDLNSSQRSTNSIQDMSAPISISASNNQQSLRRSSGSVNNSVIAHKSSLSVQTTSASSHASEGRTQIQKDKMHSFAHVVATSPHLSLIVDNNVSLKAGSELFTVAVGPRDPTWKPFGADEATDKKFDSVPVKSRFDSKSPSPERPAKIPIGTMGGCPILMQTGNGIRFLAQVPNAQVRVSLPDLIRFLQAHLVDIPKLKQFLETTHGEQVHEEQLEMYQILLERLAKYLLRPALEVDLNIKGKVVAMGNEITVTIETPTSVIEAGQEWARRVSNNKSPRRQPSPLSDKRSARDGQVEQEWNNSRPEKNLLAMSVHAQIYLADLIDDSRALEASLKSRHDRSG